MPTNDEPTIVFLPGDTPDECRHKMFLSSADRLSVIAKKALNRGLKVDQFVMVCIEVDDPAWNPLAMTLMPDAVHIWDAVRSAGLAPIARGCVSGGVRDLVKEVVDQKLAASISDIPTNGTVQVLSLGRGGVSLYNTQPAEVLTEN